MSETKPEIDREKRRTSKLGIDDWKVLIVDDRKDNLLIASEALQFHGADVQTATNGIEGLAVLEKYEASLILLDLSMPEMNGWDMHKKLRADKKLAHIPVIALTAHAMSGDEEAVMQANFDGYIAKPFSVATIVLQIQSILAKLATKDS